LTLLDNHQAYDYVLTFKSELSLIWNKNSRWRATNILFVLTRYLPWVDTGLSMASMSIHRLLMPGYGD
jgi:hypothetical protein